MYDTIKDVINSGRYELNDMMRKVDTLWVQGDLDDGQRDELVELAQANANPANSYAPLQDQINHALKKIDALESRVSVLEAGGGGSTTDPNPEEEWPEWYMWMGIGQNPWNNGSKCTHNGKKYISQVDNNIWEPGGRGVYDNIWQEVTL